MKVFGSKKLLPVLISMFLVLSASAPSATVQSMFGVLQEGQPIMVYNFEWIPILEISMMIAQYILPPKDISVATDNRSKKADNKEQTSSVDYSINTLASREPMVIKQFKMDEAAVNAAITPSAIPLPCPCSPISAQSPGILLLISLCHEKNI
ncbi:MAG: hypothetical protein ABSH12_09925 [Endomicrobiales bacterium]